MRLPRAASLLPSGRGARLLPRQPHEEAAPWLGLLARFAAPAPAAFRHELSGCYVPSLRSSSALLRSSLQSLPPGRSLDGRFPPKGEVAWGRLAW